MQCSGSSTSTFSNSQIISAAAGSHAVDSLAMKMDKSKQIDDNIPWGVYMPPTGNDIPHSQQQQDGEDKPNNHQHCGGYVRIVDAKGKSYPCGFTRPIGSVMEVVSCKKRRRSQTSDHTSNSECGEPDRDALHHPQNETEVRHQKKTITEVRLHPEEALFLHMRGLLRIESKSSGDNKTVEGESTLSTQDLFCKMLPECNIPLAAYLAYAHLRAQGYILTRYTDQRMQLLLRIRTSAKNVVTHSTKSEDTLHKTEGIGDDAAENDRTENGYDGVPARLSKPMARLLSGDVATAPPPCVVNLQSNGNKGQPYDSRLSYYAYNPNARFRRSDPGLPDFGVAVIPFHSDNGHNQPTFDTLDALVSMCSVEECRIPLRVVTVADGGKVIAFGVINGGVPSI